MDKDWDKGGTTVTPQELVDAFKRNGSFDALRTEILRSFMASPSGERFSKQTEDIIREKLRDLHDRQSQVVPTAGPTLATSPSKLGAMPKSRHETNDQIMRELERHTAYERAEQEIAKTGLAQSTKSLETDLTALLKTMKEEKANVTKNETSGSGSSLKK